MTPIIYFDMCALILVLVIVFSVIFRKMINGLSNRLFLVLSAILLVDIIFDLWAVAEDIRPDVENCSMAVRYISHMGYLFFRNLTVPVYTVYLISLTDTWHKLKKDWALKTMLILPCSVVFVMILLDPFTNLIFYFDENYKYTRSHCFPMVYINAIVYVGLGLFYLIKYRKLFSNTKLISLYSIYPLTLIATALQWYKHELLVELFFSSIALMLITITVQRPEELIDSSTGLGKYSAYADDMKRNFANEKNVGIIIINISNYTSMLSILGYDSANELLKKVAGDISAVNKEMKLRADLYYLDRGRFRIVVTERNYDKVNTAAEKINSELKNSIILNQLELNLIAYVCVAYCPKDISDFRSLMAFGNDLCGKIPFSGRVLQAADVIKSKSFHLNSEMDEIIDNAIANRNFMVYYQPIYSVEKKRFVSAEALLRLNDDKYGFIPPDLFITAAERSGAIHKIGDYVLEEVCRFISGKDFESLGLDYIEINLSVAQCMQTDLADKVLQITSQYGVSHDKINLEITETAASYAQNIMMENLEKLTQEGIKFSLDDYGTGFSNIKSVASLPITLVKLDKAFVDEEDNPRMWIVLKNTIKMLKDMDMKIVVEGIESEQLAKRFAELNCEYIQGYYYSRPIPESEFVDFMKVHA
ncbi:MAG: EAL domain-containing protein [Oscillospiraceae bacterium]